MNNTSRRRRITSRILLGGAALALPLTASISYAEVPVPTAPAAPLAVTAPAAPVAMVAPVNLAAPLPPVAPAPPQDADVEVSVDEDGTERRVRTWVLKDEDGEKRQVRRMITINEAEMSKEEMEEAMKSVREAMKEVDVAKIEAEAQREIVKYRLKNAAKEAAIIRVECNKQGGSAFVDEDGDVEVLCTSEIRGQALAGLEEARDDIADNEDIPADMRKEILKTLDDKIRQLSANG